MWLGLRIFTLIPNLLKIKYIHSTYIYIRIQHTYAYLELLFCFTSGFKRDKIRSRRWWLLSQNRIFTTKNSKALLINCNPSWSTRYTQPYKPHISFLTQVSANWTRLHFSHFPFFIRAIVALPLRTTIHWPRPVPTNRQTCAESISSPTRLNLSALLIFFKRHWTSRITFFPRRLRG